MKKILMIIGIVSLISGFGIEIASVSNAQHQRDDPSTTQEVKLPANHEKTIFNDNY